MTDSISGDGRNYEVRNPEKLTSLKNLLLKKADDERESILDSARRESAAWLKEQEATLDHMVEQIHAEAVKRAEEISKRQISGAEMARTKDRLRMQNSLIEEALSMLQKELTALRERPDYSAILTGLALEAAEKLPEGTAVRLQLASEDEAVGQTIAGNLAEKRPDLSVSFDANAAPIIGGVWLSAPDGSWRAPSDWREIITEAKDSLAERILSVL